MSTVEIVTPEDTESHEAEIVSIDPTHVADQQKPIRDLIDRDPRFMEEVRQYYELLQIDYARRVAGIEKFLGFLESNEDLGVRIARLEAFTGVK